MATAKVATSFAPGTHGSTFGGNPLACSAALAVLDEIESAALLGNVKARGEQLHEGLLALQNRYPLIQNIRGQGLLLGAELSVDGAPLVAAAMKKGLMILLAGPKVLRFLPPLNVSKEEIQEALVVLDGVMEQME